MSTILQLGPDTAPLAGVFAHQRGGTAAGIASLAETLGGTVRWLLPEAPGRSWWPHSFLAPAADNEPAAQTAVAIVERCVEALVDEGYPEDRIVLGGFSQGGCVVAEVLRRAPRRLAGAVILSGGFAGPPGTAVAATPLLAGMPVVLTGAEDDPWVPGWRVRETAAWLTASDATVELLLVGGADHTVRPAEIAAAAALLTRLGAAVS